MDNTTTLNEISSKLDKIIELLSEIKIKPSINTYSHSFSNIDAIGRELITEEKPLPTPWNS
jgi:hypothetical protein